MNYATTKIFADKKGTVCYTSTFNVPTRQECIDCIVDYSKRLQKLKWWQSNSYLLDKIKYYAGFLNAKDELSRRQIEQRKKIQADKFLKKFN